MSRSPSPMARVFPFAPLRTCPALIGGGWQQQAGEHRLRWHAFLLHRRVRLSAIARDGALARCNALSLAVNGRRQAAACALLSVFVSAVWFVNRRRHDDLKNTCRVLCTLPATSRVSASIQEFCFPGLDGSFTVSSPYSWAELLATIPRLSCGRSAERYYLYCMILNHTRVTITDDAVCTVCTVHTPSVNNMKIFVFITVFPQIGPNWHKYHSLSPRAHISAPVV